jgi:hypothetical protein
MIVIESLLLIYKLSIYIKLFLKNKKWLSDQALKYFIEAPKIYAIHL